MLEIIILIFLTRKIGELAERKGQHKGWWKFYTVMAWIGCEIGGMMISMMITKVLVLNMLFGIFCAFGGYLLVKARLEKMPDKESMNDWINNIGNNE
jgi:hypothetical protein